MPTLTNEASWLPLFPSGELRVEKCSQFRFLSFSVSSGKYFFSYLCGFSGCF